MDEVGLRFLIKHLLAGLIAGAVVLGPILAFDVGSLATLIARDPAGLVALLLLAVGLCGTFGIGGLATALSGLGPASGSGRRAAAPPPGGILVAHAARIPVAHAVRGKQPPVRGRTA